MRICVTIPLTHQQSIVQKDLPKQSTTTAPSSSSSSSNHLLLRASRSLQQRVFIPVPGLECLLRSRCCCCWYTCLWRVPCCSGIINWIHTTTKIGRDTCHSCVCLCVPFASFKFIAKAGLAQKSAPSNSKSSSSSIRSFCKTESRACRLVLRKRAVGLLLLPGRGFHCFSVPPGQQRASPLPGSDRTRPVTSQC